MRLLLNSLIALTVSVSLIGTGVSNAIAQSTEHVANRPDVASILSKGRELEQERRWHEAIQFYEKHTKRHPSLKDVQERLQLSRVHFDVTRRYSDRTFIDTVQRSTPAEALEVLNEVLAKLDAYYVEQVDYYKLALYGTAFLEVALTEQDFLATNLQNANVQHVEQFRLNVHKSVFGRKISSREELKTTISRIAHLAQSEIGLKPVPLIYEFISGAVGMLDPYSALLTVGEYREIMAQIEGNLIGLGVELWAEGSELKIVDVFKGSPAYEAGLQPGFQILEVDKMSVVQIGAKRAADLLRGPEGTSVRLVVQGPGEKTSTIEVARKRVDIPSVSIAEMREPGIGYIRITNFQKTTVGEVNRAMHQMFREGLKTLIIDLRRNPGGLLDSSVELADQFLTRGDIVSTRGRNGHENHNFTARPEGTTNIPIVVLIDGDSASASEIFAGAIRDHNRGYVVGQVSYGKGSVQGVFHNERGNGGLRLTVSKFFSPNGTPISSRGIIPHVLVPEEEIESPTNLTSLKPPADGTHYVSTLSNKNDPILEKGLEVARQQLTNPN